MKMTYLGFLSLFFLILPLLQKKPVDTWRFYNHVNNHGVIPSFAQPKVINFVPYSLYVIDRFKQRLEWSSYAYRAEAAKRGIHRPDPLIKFEFSMRYHGPVTARSDRFIGYCDNFENQIFLTPDFHEATFFHELGHCDLNYSHMPDDSIVTEGRTDYIMSWSFQDSDIVFKREKVLDKFFKGHHYHVESREGVICHYHMASQIRRREAYLEKLAVKKVKDKIKYQKLKDEIANLDLQIKQFQRLGL